MADWDKWDGQSWYRNNKNRPWGVGTVSHARRDKMRQKALAREAAEALAKRDQAAADAAAPAAPAAAACRCSYTSCNRCSYTSCNRCSYTSCNRCSNTSCTTKQHRKPQQQQQLHHPGGGQEIKKTPEQSLDKRDVKEECESLGKRDEKKTDEKKKINLLTKGIWEMSHRGLGGQVPGEPHQPHHHQGQETLTKGHRPWTQCQNQSLKAPGS